MWRNYLTIALRQLAKNKLYACINIVGLMMGLAAYVFSTLLVGYERSHDLFFAKAERTYTVGTLFGPEANIGVGETDGVYTAFAPFIDAEVEAVEKIARTVGREYLVSQGDRHFYQNIRFADPELLDIFDFHYLQGDATALQDPSGILLSRSAAEKFFGGTDVLDEVLTLDHGLALHVTAVIEELPANTHFSASLIGGDKLEVIAPLQALQQAAGYDLAGNWNNLSSGDFTYMLLAADKDETWLQQSLDGVFRRHFPNQENGFIKDVHVRPLAEANTILWDAVGLPILDSIAVLRTVGAGGGHRQLHQSCDRAVAG